MSVSSPQYGDFYGDIPYVRWGTGKKNVMVEAQAELDHESRDSLTRIQVPILIICGTEDVYFPRAYAEEMASLVQGSSLKLYEGKGHMGALEDEAFAKDIFEFIGRVS